MAIKVKETAIPKAFMAVIALLLVLEVRGGGRVPPRGTDRRTGAAAHAVTSLTREP